jgi:hypothetical protein
MSNRSRRNGRLTPNPFATLLESRPGVPKPIDDESIDVDDLPGVQTAPVRNRDVLAVRDANGPKLGDPQSRAARRTVVRAALELAALLDSHTDHAAPPQRSADPVRAAKRARLERAAQEVGERIKKRARRR